MAQFYLTVCRHEFAHEFQGETMKRRMAVLVLFAVMAGGCAGMRKVEVGPSSAATYMVDVTNGVSAAVTVSYSAGTPERQLGTVSAGATERFIIASPASTTVTIHARTSTGASLGPYTVSLTAGVPARVTIQ
jgi:hypothetical protein